MVKKLAFVLFLAFFSATSFAADKININTATVDQLQTLDGVGMKTAMAIIEYRDTVGYFGSVEELTAVKGIGEKKLAIIAEDVITEKPENQM